VEEFLLDEVGMGDPLGSTVEADHLVDCSIEQETWLVFPELEGEEVFSRVLPLPLRGCSDGCEKVFDAARPDDCRR